MRKAAAPQSSPASKAPFVASRAPPPEYDGKEHLRRRKVLQSEDPKFIESISGPDWRLSVVAGVVLAAHLGFAVYVAPLLSWFWLVAFCSTGGALLAHMSFLGMHEVTHDHFFADSTSNMVWGFLIQTPLVLPVSTLFRKFHAIHHATLANAEDPDEPSAFEERWFLGSALGRAVWASSQWLWYIVRPLGMPELAERASADRWKDVLCFAWQGASLFGLAHALAALHGPAAWADAATKALSYCALSIMFAMGPSPLLFSAHFLAEHRPSSVLPPPALKAGLPPLPAHLPEAPSFNYYGPGNLVSYNVGYHTEHHDFPNVSGFRLPALSKRFKGYYDWQPICPGWWQSVAAFILEPYPFKQIPDPSHAA